MDVTSFLEISLKTEEDEIKEELVEPATEFCKVQVKEETEDENGDMYMEEDADESSEDGSAYEEEGEQLLQDLRCDVEEQESKTSGTRRSRGTRRTKVAKVPFNDMAPIDLSKRKRSTVAGKQEVAGGGGDGDGGGDGGGARTPKKHACGQCGKAFATPSHLRTHARTHSGTRPFRCADCPAAFAQSNNLRRHRRTHTRERPYRCTDCDCAFRDSSHLQRHRLLHSGERPYRCETCGTAFAQSNTLRDHTRLHTGERPFACDQCPEAFVRRSHLNAHWLRAHSNDVQTPLPTQVVNEHEIKKEDMVS